MKTTVALGLLILLLVAGCSPQPMPEAPTPIRTLYPATLPAVVTQPPPAGTQPPGPGQTPAGSGSVEAGQQVFAQNCSPCHNLTNETKVGPGLAGLFSRAQLPNGKPVNDENLKEWIHTGGGGMPAIPVPDTDIEPLIAFLREATK